MRRPNFAYVFSVSAAAWGLAQPLIVAVEALALMSGLYSFLVSLAGFALGFFFPLGPGV